MISMDGWTGQLPSSPPPGVARLQALGMAPPSGSFTVKIVHGSGGSSDTINLGDGTVWTVTSWVLPETDAKGKVRDTDGAYHPFEMALQDTPTGHELTCRIDPEDLHSAGNDNGSWSANDGKGMMPEGDCEEGHRHHHGSQTHHPQALQPMAATG